nr:protein kinase-like domain, phloem protein 2-like protein [Tanacetum cinerariifolium]
MEMLGVCAYPFAVPDYIPANGPFYSGAKDKSPENDETGATFATGRGRVTNIMHSFDEGGTQINRGLIAGSVPVKLLRVNGNDWCPTAITRELSHSQSEEKSLVAIKRLDRIYGQGDPEFFKEIRMLSCYRHENLISLLGFCCQGGEMILIYEYASGGSLDHLLSSADLTWAQRLRICIDAAKGLSFLHDPNGTQQRVLHCDIKSANILLDENMTAKVSDFGLSKMGPANQQYSLLITGALGTPGYCDPVFLETYSLTKESDVYSFGVVLLEILLEMLTKHEDILKAADPLLTYVYKTGKQLKELLSKGLIINEGKTWLSVNEKGEHIERIYIQACLNPAEIEDNIILYFQGGHVTNMMVHSKHLWEFTSKRKTADLQFQFEYPATDLQVAGIEFQPSEEKVELQVFEEYQHIIEAASQSLACRSLQELKQILMIGIHLNDYKTWFSLNKKGEHCHLISMEDCLIANEDFTPRYKFPRLSRFPIGFYKTKKRGFRTHVKTQLLNPVTPYTVNLVIYVSSSDHQVFIDLKYRINGETRTSTVYLAKRIHYSLFMAELYQVTSNGGLVDLEIDFENSGINIIGVEGILFQPLEKVKDQVLEDDTVKDIQPILDLDSDTYWGQKLPNDYEEILKLSNHCIEGKTKKELYSMFCQGFLIDNGQQWFAVDKNGKKWQMLSARAACVILKRNSTWESSNESRFGKQLCKVLDIITQAWKIGLVH